MTSARTAPRRRRSSSPAHLRTEPGRATAWFGWRTFTSIMLVVAGLATVARVLAATAVDTHLASTSPPVVDIDPTAWGWAVFILGATLAHGRG